MMADDKRQQILNAAVTTFGAYGFKRTSMEDIAHAASISRPALYQHFSSKTDIYRAVVEDMMGQSIVLAREAMTQTGSLKQRIGALLTHAVIAPMRAVGDMPHGAELLDMKQEAAVDLLSSWYDTLNGIILDALVGDGLETELAADIADTVIMSLKGLKTESPSPDKLAAGCQQIARIAEAAGRNPRQ